MAPVRTLMRDRFAREEARISDNRTVGLAYPGHVFEIEVRAETADGRVGSARVVSCTLRVGDAPPISRDAGVSLPSMGDGGATEDDDASDPISPTCQWDRPQCMSSAGNLTCECMQVVLQGSCNGRRRTMLCDGTTCACGVDTDPERARFPQADGCIDPEQTFEIRCGFGP